MDKILIAIIIFIALSILWALPLYICVNLVLWLFGVSFHLTLIQSFGLCLLITVIRNLFFKNNGGN